MTAFYFLIDNSGREVLTNTIYEFQFYENNISLWDFNRHKCSSSVFISLIKNAYDTLFPISQKNLG